MPYIIDGHNLIGKMPELSLADLDDEQRLFEYLEPIFRRKRKKATIFFDHGNPEHTQKFSSAFLKVQFVKQPLTADEVIIAKLNAEKGNARNYTVVSSDNWIIGKAEKSGAKVISCESFLKNNAYGSSSSPMKKGQSDEVDYWLDRFKKGS